MSSPTQENQVQQQPEEVKQNDKEYNFRRQEQMFQKQLDQERQARAELERKFQEELSKRQNAKEEDDEAYSEPYVDEKYLSKKLNKFGQNTQSEIQKAMEMAKQKAKEELRQEMYLEQNPDFFQTLQLADSFAQKNPRLADTILKMPEGFERQKLVYENIKAMGLDKPQEQSKQSIQGKIEENRRSPYYQPSGIGSAPYNQASDFSPTGQKSAYDKMQQLKKQLRL